MKRNYSEEKTTYNSKKFKLSDADVQEIASFEQWKKDAGLLTEEWDEKRNGPLAHRCLDSVLYAQYKNNYVRPLKWNDPSKYHQITFLNGDGGDGSNFHYLRCDQLSPSQFDHLMTANFFNGGEHGIFSRIDGWFSVYTEDLGSTDLDKDGLSEYGYSHMKEHGCFREDKVDADGNIIILKNRLEKPLVAECAFHIGFAVSLYVCGW